MKSNMIFKRRELKYRISKEQKDGLMAMIGNRIIDDPIPRYSICNIYFDTPDNRLIRRSIEKPVYKEKMRLRSYGVANQSSKIFVELKKKYDGVVYKRRVTMNLSEAENYISGDAARNGQIESEIDYFLDKYTGIGPAMYISYDREAFCGAEDNELRITFDNNILWRDSDVSLTSESYGNKILTDDEYLLEIKCANSMPLWLVKALSDNRIYKSSFSKYGVAYLARTAS